MTTMIELIEILTTIIAAAVGGELLMLFMSGDL